jgi:hypothetical protein
MAEWLIGYKVEEKTLGEMSVKVDQCSPKEHYLFLYNEEEQEPIEVEDDVATVEPEALARVLGVISPGSWAYAINTDVINHFVEPFNDEEEG